MISMDNQKTIILLLLVVILLLLIIAGIMFSNSIGKEKSQLAISDKTLFEGDSLVVILTDNRGLPIADAAINVKLTDDEGITIDEDVKTNSKGKAALNVDEKGNYSLEAIFGGNDKYESSSISDNIEVKKASTEVVNDEKAPATTHASKYDKDGSIFPEYGPEVDSQGVTREYAIANNWHYMEMRVDGDVPGDYITVGGYVPYDSKAGCYHT